ncbi:MAG: NAD(P)-dependent oxidoreductase [Planctomycetes bacterium]|nr:NAD(P)-dependent oxidoreductase [Planctomycetota bacterium]
MYVGVTGATGKIGRWLVRELLDRGHRVRAMTRPTRDGFWGNTSPAVAELEGWGAEIFYADFAADDSLARFAQEIEVLVHNGYHHVNEDHHPVEWTNLNILATVKLYEAFWKSGGRQIVFISSGAVYGRGPVYEEERFGKVSLPIDEKTLTAPRGLYAVYKSAIEHTTVVFKTVHGLKPSTSLRPGSGAGLGQLLGYRCYDDEGVLTDEIKRLLKGEKVSLKLAPDVTLVDGRDLGIACDLVMNKGLKEGAEIFDWYIAGNRPIPAQEFAEIVKEVFGPVPLEIEIVNPSRLSSNRMLLELGYKPRGSAATLRDHLHDLAGKLGIRAPVRS